MGCNSSKGVSETSKAGACKAGDHLSSPDDLTALPTFPAGTKSLVCKYLTKDIWNKYHDKSDASGVSFKTCVFSGCKNVDSGIGCYAGSADSYTTFSDFFDKIVQDYHKHGPKDKHVSCMDASLLNISPFTEEEAALVKSTRIRVGRNLAEFPLGPGITDAQRDDIMAKVVEACSKFTGELAGTFYSLDSMSAEQQQQLIDDHFLFK